MDRPLQASGSIQTFCPTSLDSRWVGHFRKLTHCLVISINPVSSSSRRPKDYPRMCVFPARRKSNLLNSSDNKLYSLRVYGHGFTLLKQKHWRTKSLTYNHRDFYWSVTCVASNPNSKNYSLILHQTMEQIMFRNVIYAGPYSAEAPWRVPGMCL